MAENQKSVFIRLVLVKKSVGHDFYLEYKHLF